MLINKAKAGLSELLNLSPDAWGMTSHPYWDTQLSSRDDIVTADFQGC